MRKTMFKVICLFTLVFFVMSMTGAAACCNCNSCKTKASYASSCKTKASYGSSCKIKTDAINDTYAIKLKKCPNIVYCFNVLKNDKGCNLKVCTETITTAQGGKVTMQSNGKICYKAPSKCCSGKGSCTDTFTYKIKGCDGKTDSAKVTLKLTCPTC